jgi:hypothetical protein
MVYGRSWSLNDLWELASQGGLSSVLRKVFMEMAAQESRRVLAYGR